MITLDKLTCQGQVIPTTYEITQTASVSTNFTTTRVLFCTGQEEDTVTKDWKTIADIEAYRTNLKTLTISLTNSGPDRALVQILKKTPDGTTQTVQFGDTNVLILQPNDRKLITLTEPVEYIVNIRAVRTEANIKVGILLVVQQ